MENRNGLVESLGKINSIFIFVIKPIERGYFVGRKRIDHLQINDLIVAKVIRTKQQTIAKAVYVLKEV